MEFPTSAEDDRLEALRELLAEIANGIRVAQESLGESENLANTAYVVADSLGRLGLARGSRLRRGGRGVSRRASATPARG